MMDVVARCGVICLPLFGGIMRVWHVDDTGRVACSLFSSCAGPFWQYFLWQCPDAEGVVGRRRKKEQCQSFLPTRAQPCNGAVCGKVCARKTVIFRSAQKWHSRESWTPTAKKSMGAWCHSDMRKNDIFSFYVSSKDFHTRINVGYIVYTNAYAPRT